MFVYGTQYLRGATPERDQWEKDMENMKKLGFNTIRAWLVWNCIERREGDIDYRYISDFLDLAKQYSLQVGLLFHLHACPAWAVKKFSKYFYVTEDNLPFEPAVRPNTPSSGWPGLCYDNEEVRDMERRFITSVLSETRKHDNVAFYEPMNEPHQWVDMTKNPVGFFCYCPATVKKYQGWLKSKYKDIQSLNEAWGYFYNDFEEVRPPRWTASYSDYIDFRQFEVDNVAEEISFRADIIRSLDYKPVIAHAWGGGCVTCPQLGGMAFDDWKNAKVFDKWGYSAFPRNAESCAALGLGCDATRCAAGGKEYWQSELTAGVTGSIFSQKGRLDTDTFDKFTLESIRHGAGGLLYWQYRKERIGAEFGGFSMTDFDGGATPLTEKARQLGDFLKTHGKILKEGISQKAEVALVFSIRSYFTDWAAHARQNKNAVNSMIGYYQMFWEENIPVDILHEEHSGDLSAYKVVILPSAMAIAPDFAKKLEQYIRNGGTVFSEQMFGIFDPSFKLSYTVPGYGFDRIFGARQDDLVTRENAIIYGKKDVIMIAGSTQTENYKNITAEILYRYDDGSPAVLRNTYGSGTVYITGVNLGISYSSKAWVGDDFESGEDSTACKAAKDLVLRICYTKGVAQNCCSAEGVKVSVVKTRKEALVILINSSPDPASGTVALESAYGTAKTVYGSGTCVVVGEKLQFTLGANKSAVCFLLPGVS